MHPKPDTQDPLREALENAEQTLRMIADSFTSPSGDFIEDDMTRTEWRQMLAALERVDEVRAGNLDLRADALSTPGQQEER